MADDGDVSVELNEAQVESALASRVVPSRAPSLYFCADCDDVIPHKRRPWVV